jgi:hypothetical protein
MGGFCGRSRTCDGCSVASSGEPWADDAADTDVVTRTARVPGDLLLHPVALVALVLVIFNDMVLKVSYPSVLSGKLSDFAGLVYFPLFLVAAFEGLRWLRRRSGWELTPRAVVVAVVVVGSAFVAIKVSYPAGEVYRTVMGMVWYPLDLVSSVLGGNGVPPLSRVALVQDRVDLIAVPSLLLPVWVARRVMTPPTVEVPPDR